MSNNNKSTILNKYLYNDYKQKGEEKKKDASLKIQDMKEYEQQQSVKAKQDLINEEAHNQYKKYVFTQEAMEQIKLKKKEKEADTLQKELNKMEYREM